MSPAIKVQLSSFLAVFLSSAAVVFSSPPSARARCLNDCVAQYQGDYDMKADEVMPKASPSGVGFRGENRSLCISRATVTFSNGLWLNEAAHKAQEFCSRGGDSACLSKAYNTFSKGVWPRDAAIKANEFCIGGGDYTCLAQLYTSLSGSLWPGDAVQKSAQSCRHAPRVQ